MPCLGVPEYWITDYLGLGGREYIGQPKAAYRDGLQPGG